MLFLRLTWLDVDVVAKATSDMLVFTRASALYVGVEEAPQHASVGLHQDSDREQGCVFSFTESLPPAALLWREAAQR
jgi:hypothetical protein